MEKSIGVIDIGSNTVKMVIYKIKNERKFIKQFTKSIYLRLFRYLKPTDDGGYILSEEGFKKCRTVLEEFKEELDSYNVDYIIAFATYVIRVSKNKDDFVNYMKDLFDIKILSEKEEAYYSAYGALLERNIDKGLIADMGGGSLELCSAINNRIDTCVSFPLGTLYFMDFFKNGVLVDEEGSRKLVKSYINPSKNEKLAKHLPYGILIGVGGSIRAISKIVGTKKIKKSKLDEVLNILKDMKPEEIANKYPISERRSETIVPAVIAMSEIMEEYCCDILYISKYGIREGILYHYIKKGLVKI